MTKRAVRIVDYDPQWVTLYEKEKDQILGVIGHITISIEHIGSTAVCGLGESRSLISWLPCVILPMQKSV